MKNNRREEQKKTKRKILPTIIGLLQGFFVSQIVTAFFAIVIALSIGLDTITGNDIFYGVGIGGYWLSVVILIIGIIFLLIGAKRSEELFLRDVDKKFGRILEGSILTILLLTTGIVLTILKLEIWSFIVFGIVNILASAAFSGLVLMNFEKMLQKVSNKNTPANETVFIKNQLLLVTLAVISVGFVIVVPIIYSIYSNSAIIIDKIMVCHFVAMLLYGIVGEILIIRMKKQWINPGIINTYHSA